MFDFLKNKFSKTIKDASDSIPEEELTEHDKEFAQDLDDLEAAFNSIEEKYTTEETEEESSKDDETKEEEESKEEIPDKTDEKTETTSDDMDKKEEEEVEAEEVVEVKEDETEEVSSDKIEETLPEEEESKDEAEDKVEETATPEKEEEKEEKKGRFGFLKHFKKGDKKEDKKEVQETKEEVTEQKVEEEVKEETKEEPVKEEKVEKKPKKEVPEEKSGGMFSFITQKTIHEDDIEDILEELFMSLLEGDVAYEVADKIVEDVKEDLVGKKIKRRGDMELFTTNALKKAITEIIDNGSYDLIENIQKSKDAGEPYKIMFVGINGTGKTTTIAKLAKYLEKHGYSSVFGASDTFRAGAIEQLEHHADNLNLKIIKHARNSDPAAVAFDAVEHARSTGKDVVLIDTSGRMQTNANLMDEMKKIKRVSKPDFVMYVGDALMGNDATEQASKFNEVIDIDGIILTKADADAKGGAALSIGHVINKPILFVGTGQSYDDLMEFKPEWMINLIFEE